MVGISVSINYIFRQHRAYMLSVD